MTWPSPEAKGAWEKAQRERFSSSPQTSGERLSGERYAPSGAVVPRLTNTPLTALAYELGISVATLPPAERLEQVVKLLAVLKPEERLALEHEVTAWGALTPEETRARLAAPSNPLAMASALRRWFEERGYDISQLNDPSLELLIELTDELKHQPPEIPEPGPKYALIALRNRMFLECCEAFRVQPNADKQHRKMVGKLDRAKVYDAFVQCRREYNMQAPESEQLVEPAMHKGRENKKDREKEINTLFQMRKEVLGGEKDYPLERWLIRYIQTASNSLTLRDIADDLKLGPARQRERAESVRRWNEDHRKDIEAGNLDPMNDEFDELNPA